MIKDMFGKNRVKLGLHLHTTLSDGKRTPEEVAAIYKAAGFDAIALTDHWYYGEARELCGLPILSGVEYHTSRGNGADSANGVYHIVGLMMKKEPELSKELSKGAAQQEIVDAIHKAGGLAVLAHPAWSLNTAEELVALRNVDATEIYNTTSGCNNNRRPDSSVIIDQAAMQGCLLGLLATDDAHRYDKEACVSYIMAECDSTDRDEIYAAIKERRYYATQGPEIHLSRDGDTFRVDCSPAREIVFMSDLVWAPRATEGHDLTHAEYTTGGGEVYVRAFVTDKDGKRAWSNCIKV